MEWLFVLLTATQIVVYLLFSRSIEKKLRRAEPISDKETRILKLYENIEDLMDTFEDYIGEVREELERERTSLAELSRQATVIYQQVLSAPAFPPAPASIAQVAAPETVPVPSVETPTIVRPLQTPSRLSERDREALGRFVTKPQKIRFLMSRGLSVDEVAREMDIGKGEVRLIAGLEK